MFGRFSTALQNAVDVLAPPPPLHEDFAYHWKKLIRDYLDATNGRRLPVELTNIPARFEQILKILAREDQEIEDENRPGPCLEYLLQHSLLDLLATLASSDEPPGTRQYVFQFTSRFLNNAKMQQIAHTNVFQPLQRLVSQCDGTAPGPTEFFEVRFLLSLAAVVRRNPSLVPVFTCGLENSEASPERYRRSSCCSSEQSCLSSSCISDVSGTASSSQTFQNLIGAQISSRSTTPHNNPLFTPLVTSSRSKSVRLVVQPEAACQDCQAVSSSSSSDDNKSLVVDESAQFPLLDAAISYIQSPDCHVRVKACQAIMLLVSIPDSRAAEVIVSDTLLLSRLTARLCDLYHCIPFTTEPGAIDDMHVSWGLDMASSDVLWAEGSRQLASFLAWYDFCDQVIAEAHSTIGQALAWEIRDKFLSEIFVEDTLSQPLAITLLAKMFKVASSRLLNEALSEWLVGDRIVKETPSSKNPTILRNLLSNWASPRTDLVLETLRFFEVVLDKSDLKVLDALMFVYLDSYSFLDACNNLDDTLEETIDPLQIERIVQSFVNLVPVGLRVNDDGGYEQYVAESRRQYSAVLSSLKGVPVANPTPVRPQNELSACKTRRELFFEGPFLRTLFNSLANIPYQAYEVNLELTGIVSKVCLRPERSVSTFLIESPFLKLVPEADTLHSVLHRVATLLASAVIARPDYEACLRATRHRLITEQPQPPSPSKAKENEWNLTFENIVVIEELCKELAAIAYVKYQHRANCTSKLPIKITDT
ncbi:Retinoic acid induced 16-like protein [Nesidiocoris tenuis]|uniref:Retinoic acid induced 16-like protein n=1 Tax=Nesidiocoris tenuis TaxID=355587 RepID=A0ABN7BBV6_9HEMI|nr:Retinoic acid induced 16-like protein [Nesidiocoris tenuis]